MSKRKSPIAKSLVSNSVAAIMSAIEIHNKPIIRYRYEMVVLLTLNAWELLLKGYLYKYQKKVKLFMRDGTTKPFDNCLNIVNQKIGKEFNAIQENLNVLYGYRNQVAHFYITELDPIIYSLVRKNILFYSKFLYEYFKIDLSKESDLILLPIGFKKPFSPIDYISNSSVIENTSKEVKVFIKSLLDATKRLSDNDIEETIFVDFKMSLTNVSKTKNADIIAGIDNSKINDATFSVSKSSRVVKVSKVGEKIILTRDKSESQGTILYEELQEGIFEEINNIIDANRLLAKNTNQFMLGAPIYYRIYAERNHVNYNISNFELFAKTAMKEFYSPFLFWLNKLPENNIAKILFEIYDQSKTPRIHNLIKIIILLGEEAIVLFTELFNKKYERVVQKPDFYYTFNKLCKSTKANSILKSLNTNNNKRMQLFNNSREYNYGDFLKDNALAINTLSRECINVFNGTYEQRATTRELDYLAYGPQLINNQKVIDAVKELNLNRAK